ncbi:MAG: MgtC/SapB family protein [Clostridia bacterium]|nr:MgtC/SapB family protein [Clostridia bacterium]
MDAFINAMKDNVSFEELWLALDLLLAALLGFLIGLERKSRYKEAGIRTHTIVAFGAALMMVVSKHAFGSEADSARVAAQIVAGIGFLGAGIIVYKKNVVHGLTTAAGVWTTAGIGMACGGGLWVIACIATAVLIFIQWLLHRNWRIFKVKKIYSIKISFVQRTNERDKVKQIFDIDRYNRLVVERKGEDLIYHAKLDTVEEYSSTQLDDIMKKNTFIISIERCDDN